VGLKEGQRRLAKHPDHPAGGFEAEDTGGLLSGLLAEEEDLDHHALWRIASWGVGATGAVVLAVMANQSSFGIKRDQGVTADLSRQTQQIQLAARETQNEARRLASAVNTLNGDRDRLYARVTSLELGLDSVTGTIARQSSAAAPAAAANAAPQAAQNPAPAPAIAAVATIQPLAPLTDHPAAASPAEPGSPAVWSAAKDAAKSEPAKTELAKIEPSRTDSIKPDSARPEPTRSEPTKGTARETARPDDTKSDTTKADAARTDVAKASPATPLVAAQSIMAPPDPAAGKLLEPRKPPSSIIASPIPEVVASAPSTNDAEDDANGPKVALQRTEFGVDVGSANSVSGLRALWRGLLKSRSNAPLKELRPIIVVKEGANGLGMQLRLVAGPLNDAGAAARICAVLTENNRPCETVIFDGQRLSLSADDPKPVATKPAPRRRGAAKQRPAIVVVEEPKKPETSTTLSSFFGRKNSQ
jgi:hypothetical protein